jgi:cell division protein FtsL
MKINRIKIKAFAKQPRAQTYGIMLLGVLVFFSALMVVYQKHLSRQLFTQLQHLHQEVDGLQIEWGQLLLEQGTWASDARVERLAQTQLHMVLPEPNQVVVITESE